MGRAPDDPAGYFAIAGGHGLPQAWCLHHDKRHNLKAVLENKVGSVAAAHAFSIKRSSPVSVRVKDIDRLNIPGSFVVKLLAVRVPGRSGIEKRC
ncbi:MAG TPA: hypothetical protein VFQ68_46430 [Streptosporangiaceae bacterium]|nr:hypothetical protein [Streptosporangiaceae bacterium]